MNWPNAKSNLLFGSFLAVWFVTFSIVLFDLHYGWSKGEVSRIINSLGVLHIRDAQNGWMFTLPETNESLDGGFKYVLCSWLFGEDSHSDYYLFRTWFYYVYYVLILWRDETMDLIELYGSFSVINILLNSAWLGLVLWWRRVKLIFLGAWGFSG